jgi:NAD-dependent dihydropyrimidine dehydrogenase PreA subunit
MCEASEMSPPRHQDSSRRRRTPSAFIALDRGSCEACWECIAACPKGVIDKMDMWLHRHAVVRAGDLCTGCGRCVKVCPSGALTAIDRS